MAREIDGVISVDCDDIDDGYRCEIYSLEDDPDERPRVVDVDKFRFEDPEEVEGPGLKDKGGLREGGFETSYVGNARCTIRRHRDFPDALVCRPYRKP